MTPYLALDSGNEFANIPDMAASIRGQVSKRPKMWGMFKEFGYGHMVDITVLEVNRFKSLCEARRRTSECDAPLVVVHGYAVAADERPYVRQSQEGAGQVQIKLIIEC